MANILPMATAFLLFAGFVVYLAGVADSNAICKKAATDATYQPITSVGDMSKYVPQAAPWSFTAGMSSGSSGRKMLSLGSDGLQVAHGRALLDVASNTCGWSYALPWWTVALQGLAVILIIIALFSESIAKHKMTFLAFIYVNTPLLCIVANTVVFIAFDYNQVKAKGPAVSAVYATTAGLIISLIANFMYFIVTTIESHDFASVTPHDK